MSSVTRFLRQIPTGLNYGISNVGTISAAALDFIPTSGNYVGNYPPGYLVPGSQTGLQTAISQAITGNAPGAEIIRDMGKTIFAPFTTTVGGNFTGYGFFRQYQVLMVKPIVVPPGFLGGTGGNTFGVVGPSVATSPGTSTYCTFYLPVSVQGVGTPSSVGVESVEVIGGGQM